MKKKPNSVTIFQHDLPRSISQGLKSEDYLFGDTETDGLLVRRDKLRLVQLMDNENNIFLIRNPNWNSINLKNVFDSTSVVFHHSLFDTTFLAYWMDTYSMADCTKILSKITSPNESSSLAKVLKRELGVTLNNKGKEITTSNWNAPELSTDQIEYACEDVLYLPELKEKLLSKLTMQQHLIYASATSTIRQKIQLEIKGYTDLLQYESDQNTSTYREQWLKHKAEMEKQC